MRRFCILCLVALCLNGTPLRADYSDPVLRWNAQTLEAVRISKMAPPLAAHHLAMVHAAIFDAVNAIHPAREPIWFKTKPIPGASVPAAVTAAAHRVLTTVFPEQSSIFDQKLREEYADIPDGEAKKNGIKLGREAAEAIIAWRRGDKSDKPQSYPYVTEIGRWNPSLNQKPVLPNWADVRCFVIESCDQFRPAPPPALNSEAYAEIFNDVKELGSRRSAKRTPAQTEIALFWDKSALGAAGLWNMVAARVSQKKCLSSSQTAHLFALLNLAMADAGIAAWDCKYHYCFWRPVEAIRKASKDGNDWTAPDPNWEPLVATPPHPDYVSAHSTFSGAAATILIAYFGDEVPFKVTVDEVSPDTRVFNSFREAAQEAGRSRIYAGVHFETANETGLQLGRDVALFTTQHVAKLKRGETTRLSRGE